MAAIEAIPHNGLVVASFFSGCGGSCLGYRMAGYRVAWANEFEPNAGDTHAANHAGCILDRRDIRTIQADEILSALKISSGDLDLMDGSPPCQSFSTSGMRAKGWGKSIAHADGTKQRSDDLFFEYARLLRGIMPKVFVAENVSGLVKGAAKGYFKLILAELKSCGYRVTARLLDAQWLGVPQARQRIIFVGIRNDIGVDPIFPIPLPWRYTVADACPWLASSVVAAGNDAFDPNFKDATATATPTIMAGGARTSGIVIPKTRFHIGSENSNVDLDIDVDAEPSPTVMASSFAAFSHQIESDTFDSAAWNIACDDSVDLEKISVTPLLKKKWSQVQVGKTHPKYFNLSRSSPSNPSPTICAAHFGRSINQVMPPFEARKFTILEVKRLCSFPDDFKMLGTFQQRWARLGNSVPPLMAKAVGETIRDKILMV